MNSGDMGKRRQGRPRIADIVAPEELRNVSREPDPRTRQWQEDQEREAGELRLTDLRLEIELRAQYSARIFGVVTVWLLAILGLLYVDGFGVMGFDLGENVLMTALGTTTLNVIGLLTIVARYIFPNR